MLTTKPRDISILDSDERRKEISDALLENASVPFRTRSGRPGIPMFELDILTAHALLKEEVLRIAVEYVDLLLLQDEVKDRPFDVDACAEDSMVTKLRNEFILWNIHAFQRVHSLLNTDKTPLNNSDSTKNGLVYDLVGKMIKLSLVTKQQLNSRKISVGDIPAYAFPDHLIKEWMDTFITLEDVNAGNAPKKKEAIANLVMQYLDYIATAVKGRQWESCQGNEVLPSTSKTLK